ncbi:MAG: amidohydrolase family protein [Clostridia bacterium]|nr:amidohydrolase family protein [Clostridia bacterium]
MEKIQVFDARMTYGRPFLGTEPELTLAETMAEAEAERAVVVHRELVWLPPCRTMPLVKDRTAKTEGAYGLYLLLPTLPGEMPPVEELATTFKRDRIAGFYLCQEEFNVPYHPAMFRDEFAACEALSIPIFYHRDGKNSFEYLAEIMERHPKLKVVLSVNEEWPNARKIYPLMKAYPGISLCLSEQVWMGAIEDMVEKFGSKRLLYSSSYPVRYPGGTVMMVQAANITEEDKKNIFYKNMETLIGGIACDSL